ncbi:MAG: cysteine synthase A, partial [Bacteroidaceae bacterium]|nr:cysteine synthase A [Bacteroidaceae bacterium]
MIYSDLIQLIGRTPLLDLQRLASSGGALAQVVAKVEFFNPGGSVKDRVALGMIEDAEQRGELHPGSVIIEPTSGNTGVGLAWISRVKGYRTVIVMPDTMSLERQSLLRAAGAELVLTDGTKGMQGAIEEAERLRSSIPGAVILGQFDNPSNPAAHERTTGEEIWQDTQGKVDIFVAGVGTGGTLTGVARTLKRYNPDVQIVAVEPAGSPVLGGGKPGVHGLQGIGAGFIPKTMDISLMDEVFPVTEEEAYTAARQLSATEGLLVGISSGAAVHAALQIALRPENKGKRIVVLLPDTGERYLSTKLFMP